MIEEVRGGDGGVYSVIRPKEKQRPITKIRCDYCGSDDSLKISSRQKGGNHYLICQFCGHQPMLKDAKKAWKRSPEKEIVEAASRMHRRYDPSSRNPNHHRAYDGRKRRIGLAADRAAEQIKRLKKALLFFTTGQGLYDGYSVEDLLEEMDAHEG